MPLIVIDFETFYDTGFSLSRMTTEEYIRDPRFEVIGVGVKVGDEPSRWFSGNMTDTYKWLLRFPWSTSIVVAHNATFDMAILNWVYGIKPARIADTLSMARAVDGPDAGNSLAKLAERHGLGVKGNEVVQALGKRRLDFSPADLAAYGAYCRNDCDLTYDLFQKLAQGFPLSELRTIDLTLRMFIEPVLQLDTPVLEAHLEDIVKRKEKLLGEGGISKDDLMSNPKLAGVLEKLGVEPPMKVSPTTDKETYAFAKSDEEFKALLDHPDPRVQAIVAARLGVKSTLEETRTQRFIDISKRGALPVPLKYYAAHTGRWGGDDKINLQNLPRKSPLKKALKAPKGYIIVDCDSSQIEARTLAWLSGQNDLVAAFAAGEDVYKIMASAIYGVPVVEVTEEMRFVGKTTILGCFGPDTRVLTNRGWKRIVEVQATDTLWDGEAWVSHEGVIPQGEKEVLTAHGLTATLDHEILTEHGWREWQEVATNPFLFRSATNRANWKSSGGSVTTYQPGVQRDITPWCDALAGGKGAWTGITSKLDAQRDATGALRGHLRRRAKSTGDTRISSLISNIASACSTVSQVVSYGATTLTPKPILTTGVGAYSYTPSGVQTGGPSCDTSSRSTGGTTRSANSTGWITPKGTSRVTSALLRAARTLVTSVRPAPCRRRSQTYDIAYAGPRNRYTVATAAGPIIVHNCGYGMGAPKFRAQLKTLGRDLPLEECEKIIRVYRETYPMIPEFWRRSDMALEALMQNMTAPLDDHGSLLVDRDNAIRLPNGFVIRYKNLRRAVDPRDGKVKTFYDTMRGKSVVSKSIWGGSVTENVCQALARIIVGGQMLKIAEQHRVTMTVHDSVVALVPEANADEARAYIEKCMRTAPPWAKGLPLNCESKMGATYGG